MAVIADPDWLTIIKAIIPPGWDVQTTFHETRAGRGRYSIKAVAKDSSEWSFRGYRTVQVTGDTPLKAATLWLRKVIGERAWFRTDGQL